MRNAIYMVVLAALTGCVTTDSRPPVWVKKNAQEGEYERNRYECLQNSQQRVSSSTTDKSGGRASSSVETNHTLYNSCMAAKGWVLTNYAANAHEETMQRLRARAAADEAKGRLEKLNARVRSACTMPETQAMFQKTACQVEGITLEHQTDTSYITVEQKAAVSAYRKQLIQIERDEDAVNADRGTQGARAAAVYAKFTRPAVEKSLLALYSGEMNWGQFNKMRKAIQAETQNQLQQ